MIELLVVIAIIGLLTTIGMIAMSNSRKKARDSKRLADMYQIRTAIELYYNDNNQYPMTASSNGEVIGDNGSSVAGTIENLLAPYMSSIAPDPFYNGDTGIDDFYYAYDKGHYGCPTPTETGPVVSINRFELQATRDKYGHRDTSTGADMNIDTADYNFCLSK